MTSQRLPNYLRAYRKRAALSQEEVAYLLGCLSGAKVCRYERFLREPELVTALACQIIFRRPVGELFPGILEKVEREVISRARILERKAAKETGQPLPDRKRQSLAAIISGDAKDQLKRI